MTPKLPIPTLEETLTRYLKWVKPLITPEQWQQTKTITEQFLHTEGPILQEQLQQYANSLPHGNWLIQTWLNAYLSERKPLPLSSNVAFAINQQHHGLSSWLHAFAIVCADYHHNRIDTPLSIHNTPICRNQWQILNGAIRIPEKSLDKYKISKNGRFIGIFKEGNYLRTTILNEEYEPYSFEYYQQLVKQLNNLQQNNPYPFTTPSFLGSNQSKEIFEILSNTPSNQNLFDFLAQDLFHLSWNNISFTNSSEELQAACFLPQQNTWCYKPLTLWYNHNNQNLYLHCEHTWPDGGTIAGIIQYAQSKLEHSSPNKFTPSTSPSINTYQWQLSTELQNHWYKWQQDYRQKANQYQINTIEIADIPTPKKGISTDALIQFTLQYAQLHAFQNINNTYEAVDVSHFKLGRTECIRPVSTESINFIQALHHQQATKELFQAALDEHKNRIKACKQGHGVNRHLLGLKSMAHHHIPNIFNDIAYQTLTNDFLSTSTMGNNQQIECFAFAPTSQHGFGINYTILANAWRFVVSYHQEDKCKATEFIKALKLACQQLTQWLNQQA